jgi:hypothetical protein
MTTLSLRRLWTIYTRTVVAQRFGNSMRDLALSHVAFHSGARGVLRVLDHCSNTSKRSWRCGRSGASAGRSRLIKDARAASCSKS